MRGGERGERLVATGRGSASRWPRASTTTSTSKRLGAPSSTTAWRPSGPSLHVDGPARRGRRPRRRRAARRAPRRWNQSRYTDCTSRVGNVMPVEAADLGDQLGRGQRGERRRRRPRCAHSCSDGPGPDRPGAVHRVVGEHRDVLGHRVHPQQRVEVGPPHPAGAGAVRDRSGAPAATVRRAARARWRRAARAATTPSGRRR